MHKIVSFAYYELNTVTCAHYKVSNRNYKHTFLTIALLHFSYLRGFHLKILSSLYTKIFVCFK